MKTIYAVILVAGLVTVFGAPGALAQCVLNVPASSIVGSSPSGMVCPAGDGDPAAEAWLLSTQVTETIKAQLLDANSDTLANFPWEDVWLEFEGFCDCSSNGDVVYADANSDANGMVTFTAPLSAGSCSTIPQIRLVLGGTVCATENYDLGVTFTSVDFDCNGIVEEADRLLMVPLYAAKDSCADLNNDTLWTVDDAVVLAVHRYPLPVGSPSHRCP
jgi:hypothetical protein